MRGFDCRRLIFAVLILLVGAAGGDMLYRDPEPGEFDEEGRHGGGGAAPAETGAESEERAPPPKFVANLPPHPRLLRPAAAQAPVAQGPAPTPTAIFTGSNDNGGYHPPDTMGAVGPNGIFTVSNNNIRYLNRSGNIQWGSSLNAFFPIVSSAYDPKVYYDAGSQRFFAVALDGPSSANSGLLIAVSHDSNPTYPDTRSWYRWRVQYGGTGDANPCPCWLDYPSIGISANWFAFSGTAFDIANNVGFVGVDMYLFSKSALVNGTWNNAIDNANAKRFGINWNDAQNQLSLGFVLMPSFVNVRTALMPSAMRGTFTTTFGWSFASSRPSFTMPS